MYAYNRDQRGQALLLLVAVMGLGGASVFLAAFGKPNLEAARERQTLSRMRDAREALIGFATAHGRLPRPAISVTNGYERTTPCESEAACTGFLPWATLGVSGTDAWGKLLRYSVTPVFTQAPLQRTSAFGTKTILTRLGDGTITYIAGNPDCSIGSPCMPVVLHSAGRNNFGVSVTGALLANGASGNIDEAANFAAVRHFMRRAASSNEAAPGGVFDDLVDYVDPQVLYIQMTKANALP
jgi:type II secretory pathway pseudopilin PulG